MKGLISLLIFFAGVNLNIAFSQQYEYPATKVETVIDTFYNHYIVEDKYRWLENTDSTEVNEWIEKQNKVSKKYLTKATGENNSFYFIEKYGDVEYHFPQKKGKYYFTKNSRVLWVQTDFNKAAGILVAPEFLSNKDKISLREYSVSGDSKLLAYRFCRNGSDRQELKVINIASGFHKSDHLTHLRFDENVAWKDDGFFYSKYAETGYYDLIPMQEVYFHKIGTEQKNDKLIFKRDNPDSHFNFLTTFDERFFIIHEANMKTTKSNIYYINYFEETPVLKPLFTNQDINIEIADSHDGKLIALTTYNAKNGCIVEIEPSDPNKLKLIVPEFNDAELLDIIPQKDRIVAHYKSRHNQFIVIYNYEGELLYNLQLPAVFSLVGINAGYNDEELTYSYSTYTLPPVVYTFNTKTFENKLKGETNVPYDYLDIEFKELEYLGKDSIPVPIVLVYKKGLKLNGDNPTLLETYGGYGKIEHPSFSPGKIYFIKSGGVVAYAHIRGSGEKGEDWAKQGSRINKQTAFNDFIAAAEYLIKAGYTQPSKLASIGGSHGGLIVAGAAIQRPDLFKVVIPIAAPLDMLRFENFTVGQSNIYEYGTVTDSLDFKNIRAYSPYQIIEENINYPSMLILTGENDDRVPPFHSYKFAARLQNRIAQKNPILLRVEKQTGHSTVLTKYNYIDVYGFILKELNVE